MNTLTLANQLMGSGLARKSAEAIAQAIDSRHKQVATKKEVQFGFALLIALMGAGFGYVVSILNTVISKLG